MMNWPYKPGSALHRRGPTLTHMALVMKTRAVRKRRRLVSGQRRSYFTAAVVTATIFNCFRRCWSPDQQDDCFIAATTLFLY